MKVKLTESKLRQIVAESVKRILKENETDDPHGWAERRAEIEHDSDAYLKRGDEVWSTYRMHDPTGMEGYNEYPMVDKMPKGGKNLVSKITYSKDAHNNRGYYPPHFKGKVYIPGFDEEQISLDDLSFEELNFLLKKYKDTMSVGGVPGFNGTQIAWREYWKKVLNDYANSKKWE